MSKMSPAERARKASRAEQAKEWAVRANEWMDEWVPVLHSGYLVDLAHSELEKKATKLKLLKFFSRRRTFYGSWFLSMIFPHLFYDPIFSIVRNKRRWENRFGFTQMQSRWLHPNDVKRNVFFPLLFFLSFWAAAPEGQMTYDSTQDDFFRFPNSEFWEAGF